MDDFALILAVGVVPFNITNAIKLHFILHSAYLGIIFLKFISCKLLQ